MTDILSQEHAGCYCLQGVLTHSALTKTWSSLLQKLKPNAEQKIILDLGGVQQVDSSFLAFLLAVLRLMQDKKAMLKIKDLGDNIKALMQVQGIWPLFEELIL